MACGQCSTPVWNSPYSLFSKNGTRRENAIILNPSRLEQNLTNNFETNPITMNAKSRFIFIFLVSFFAGLFSTTFLIAQNRGPKAGIKGGLNASSLYINNVTNENARLGFHGGLYGQLFSSDYF